MLLIRSAYTADEEWQRLRRATAELHALIDEHKLGLRLRRTAGVTSIRAELEARSAVDAAAIRAQAFRRFGEHGDNEALHPFRLDTLPATLPAPIAGLPMNQDISASLGAASGRPDDRWFLTERSADGDTVALVRVRRYIYERIDPVTFARRLEERRENTYFDVRLDRGRRCLFVAGGGRSDASRLAQAVLSHAVGAGFSLSLQDLPTLNAAILDALVDGFDGRPDQTSVRPADNELYDIKNVGTRTTDLRDHPFVVGVRDQGEQVALLAEFDRGKLGGSNECSAPAKIAVDVSWTLSPKTWVEPGMLLALFDRLLELSTLARLLTPLRPAIATRLRRQLGHQLTAGRVDRSVQAVRDGFVNLGLPVKTTGDAAERLLQTVVVNVLIALGDCPKVTARGRRVKLPIGATNKVFDEVLPGTSAAERDRVRHALEHVLEGASDYLEVAKRAERALAAAGC